MFLLILTWFTDEGVIPGVVGLFMGVLRVIDLSAGFDGYKLSVPHDGSYRLGAGILLLFLSVMLMEIIWVIF